MFFNLVWSSLIKFLRLLNLYIVFVSFLLDLNFIWSHWYWKFKALSLCLKFIDMATRRNVQYSRLSTGEHGSDGSAGQYDPRFDYAPRAFDKIPWKSIVLALFLLFLGSVLLFLSYFIFTGHMGGERSQAYGLLALGILTFLPGMERFSCLDAILCFTLIFFDFNLPKFKQL